MKTIRPLPSTFHRTALTLTAAVLSFAGITAAETFIGSGHVIGETRNVTGFSGVELRGSGDVIVTQGDTEGLVIEAEDNLLPLIESTVGNGGVLRLGFKPKVSVTTRKDVIYRLTVKKLDRLSVEGSGSIRAESLAGDLLALSLPGSGEISVNHVKAETVKVSLEGSGKVKLAGEAPRQSVNIDGSGSYAAKQLASSAAEVQINGSGDASVRASETLKVDINGSGEVTYHGNPKLTKSVNGSGTVNPAGAQDE